MTRVLIERRVTTISAGGRRCTDHPSKYIQVVGDTLARTRGWLGSQAKA
jgi:hypothetical protein